MINFTRNNSKSGITAITPLLADSIPYFVNDLYVPNSSGNSLEEFYKQFQRATNSSLSHNDYDNYKLKRYAPSAPDNNSAVFISALVRSTAVI